MFVTPSLFDTPESLAGLSRPVTVVRAAGRIVTVVAAFSWQFAWTPDTGYLAALLPDGSAPLTGQASAIALIILAEVWKTTPFMSLLLLAGLATVPNELIEAAKVDGASWMQVLTKVILPNMKPAIMVALLLGRYPGCEAIVRLSERIAARSRRRGAARPASAGRGTGWISRCCIRWPTTTTRRACGPTRARACCAWATDAPPRC